MKRWFWRFTLCGVLELGNKSVKNFCYLILFLSLGVISFVLLKNCNWILGDDYQFLDTTMEGKFSHSWIGEGRFWPLGLFDYSVLLFLPFNVSMESHFIYNVIILSFSVFGLFYFFNRINNCNYKISLFYIFVLYFISSFFQIHLECIYPERFIFFLQVLFLIFWINGEKKQSAVYYGLAWICSIYMIFSKEPIFGMIFVISIFNLIFGWNKLSQMDKNFHFSQIISAIIFIELYLFVFQNFYKGGGLYFERNLIILENPSMFEAVKLIFSTDPFLILISISAVARSYFILFKSDKKHLFLDGLLFGSCSYIFAYIILKSAFSYYMFPAVIFALPSFAYWSHYFWKQKKI